jgi:hypothetical protein
VELGAQRDDIGVQSKRGRKGGEGRGQRVKVNIVTDDPVAGTRYEYREKEVDAKRGNISARAQKGWEGRKGEEGGCV